MTIKQCSPLILLLLPFFAFPQQKQRDLPQRALAGKAPPPSLAPSMPRREAFANRLAQQSQEALRLGNRDDAFLYAEFALEYVQADNPDARQALVDAWYCNDVAPEYLNEIEKSIENIPKTLWMPVFAGGRGSGGGWSDYVRFPWSMDADEIAHFIKERTGETPKFPLQPEAAFVSAVDGPSQNRLTVFGNNTAEMRDREGHLLFTFAVADSMEYVVFVGKGKFLSCRKMSGQTELRDANTGRHLLWLEKGCCSGQELAGSDLYCSAHDSIVDLFDLATGTLLRSMPGLGSKAPEAAERRVLYFRASADFTKLAAVQFDGTTTVFDLGDGNRISTFSIGVNAFPMGFSTDGNILSTDHVGYVDEDEQHFSASLWDVRSGTRLSTFDFGPEQPREMACAPSGDHVVFLLKGPQKVSRARLAAFDMEDQRPLWSLSGDFDDLRDLIARKGRLTSTAFWDGSFASPTLDLGTYYPPQAPRVLFSPDGKWLCILGYTPLMTINIHEAATGRHRLTLPAPYDRDPSVAFSPDGRSLLVGQHKARKKMTSHAEIWDLVTMDKRFNLGGQKGGIGFVGWSPDGTLALTHSAGSSLAVWDAASGKKRLELGRSLSYPIQAEFSPDGTRLAVIDSGRQLVMYSMSTGKPMSHTFGKGKFQLLAFSPDGHFLATYEMDKTVSLWDLQTGKLAIDLPYVREYFDRICFSDDSRLLIGSTTVSHTVWDIRTGEKILDNATRGFAFDPKNKVFTQNRAGSIVFKNTPSQQEWVSLRKVGYGRGDFSPDGKRFAAVFSVIGTRPKAQEGMEGEDLYKIRLFDLDPDTIREKARHLLRKKILSCQQLQALLPEKYLDDRSLDTLAGRIVRSGDQGYRRCLGQYFADLAEQEPNLSKAQKQYARAFLVWEGLIDPDNLSALYHQRAARYLGAGMLNAASQDAAKALQIKPKGRPARAILMMCQLISGQYKKVAAELVKNAGLENPDPLHYYFSSALSDAKIVKYWHHDRRIQGNVEKCLRLLLMVDTVPDFEASRHGIGQTQFNHVSQEALLADLNLPDSTLDAYKMSMEALFRENAKRDENHPPSSLAYELAMHAFWDKSYLLADSLMAISVRLLRDSLASSQDEPRANKLGQALHNQSWIALFARKNDVAIRAALESLALDAQNTDVLTNLGHGYLFSGQFDKAIETYRAYIGHESTEGGVLLTDLFDLREAGIWSKDVPKALEAILARKLTEEEQADYGQ